MKIFGYHIHAHHSPWDGAPPWAVELALIGLEILTELRQNKETTMAAIDDLKAAVTDLGVVVNDSVAEIEALLVKITTPGASEADIAAAAQSIKDLTTAMRSEVDKAKATAP